MTAEINAQISAHTPLPWEGKPHLMDSSLKCNCTSWCEMSYAGGILSIHVNNGIPLVSEGGNDAPPFEEAKANAIFVDRAIHTFYPMLEALKDMRSRFHSCISDGNGEIEGDKEALQKAEATIALAEGKIQCQAA